MTHPLVQIRAAIKGSPPGYTDQPRSFQELVQKLSHLTPAVIRTGLAEIRREVGEANIAEVVKAIVDEGCWEWEDLREALDFPKSLLKDALDLVILDPESPVELHWKNGEHVKLYRPKEMPFQEGEAPHPPVLIFQSPDLDLIRGFHLNPGGDLVVLPLKKIRIDGHTQTRVQLDPATRRKYRKILAQGGHLAPMEVFRSKTDIWLANGFHRYAAYQDCNIPEVLVRSWQGTRRDALVYSAGVDYACGLPRNKADKRKAVGMLLAEIQRSLDHIDSDKQNKWAIAHGFLHEVEEEVQEPGKVKSKKTRILKLDKDGKPEINRSAVARTCGVDESTVRLALKRLDSPVQNSDDPTLLTAKPVRVTYRSLTLPVLKRFEELDVTGRNPEDEIPLSFPVEQVLQVQALLRHQASQ